MQIIVFASALSFLLGFKIAVWMSKRHVERLKLIYRGRAER